MPKSVHHAPHVVVVFVVGDRREKVRAGHGDFDRLAREGRDVLEFGDKAEVHRIDDRAPANRRRMEDMRIVRRDGLGLGLALKRRDLVPEVVEHRIRRRVPIVRAAMHLAARDDVDAGDFLFEDGRLSRPLLRIGEIARRRVDRPSPAGPWPHTIGARYARR